jgi:sugar phosphate isomerase/epimerase
MPRHHRRQFLKQSVQAAVALTAARGLTDRLPATAAPASKPSPTFAAFTESFQGWPIPKVCAKFKGIGLDGLDLTVRPGGHIEPADAAKRLPKAVAAARDHGVKILMLSTAITEANPLAEELLATASELGIGRIKLGYYRYRGFGTLRQQIEAARTKLRGVAALAAKYTTLPCVHVHSGDTIPGSGAVAAMLLDGFPPDQLGAYVDPMHMTVEGGNDGWRQGLDLLAPWIAISSIKNCKWITTGRDSEGQQRWAFRKCPVADGIAPLPQYIDALQKLGYHGLYTLHSEYADRGSWKQLNADECLEQTRLDLEYVRQFV